MTPDATAGVPWPTIVTVGGAILGVVGTALVIAAKMLIKSSQEKIEARIENLIEETIKLDRKIGKAFDSHEKLRDKYDEFLREYLKIDSTRGQKVDALFRIVDQMQDTLRELRPALNDKIENMVRQTISELKLYIRDKVQEEMKKAG